MRKFTGFAVAALAAVLATAAQAQPTTLVAQDDTANASTFTINFGAAFGGEQSVLISRTNMTLQIDETTGTALFLNYDQDIPPLMIPGDGIPGAISTGNIRVTIPSSAGGTFDPATGVFETTDDYAIFFEGDLTPFGITSPFILTSTSTGTVDAGRNAIELIWNGSGQLANPVDPQAPPFDFTYSCSVFATVTARPCADFNDDNIVDTADLGALLACWGDTCGDLNGDSTTDLADMGLLFNRWNGVGCN